VSETVIALYDDLEQAQAAVQELLANAFTGDDISVVMSDAARDYASQHGEPPQMLNEVAKGAGGGAILGGMTGLLVGLAALMVPGIGPALAAGPIAAALLGSGLGAAAGGIVGVLADLGLQQEHSRIYAEAVRRGGILLGVRALGERGELARTILDRHEPLDVNSRALSWRDEGWDGFDLKAGPDEARAMSHTANYYDEMNLGQTESDEGSASESSNRPSGPAA
jgi:uncharacterized membrane protein